MAAWLWWTLAASVGIALIVMVVAFVMMRMKINKIKREYAPKTTSAALENLNNGVLLWDEKEKAVNPLNDDALTFAINSMIRNNYKTFKVLGGTNYEIMSLKELAKVKESKTKPDFILVLEKNPVNILKKEYAILNKGGMMFFANAPKRKKSTKDLIYDLKLQNIKYDLEKIGGGIVIVVK